MVAGPESDSGLSRLLLSRGAGGVLFSIHFLTCREKLHPDPLRHLLKNIQWHVIVARGLPQFECYFPLCPYHLLLLLKSAMQFTEWMSMIFSLSNITSSPRGPLCQEWATDCPPRSHLFYYSLATTFSIKASLILPNGNHLSTIRLKGFYYHLQWPLYWWSAYTVVLSLKEKHLDGSRVSHGSTQVWHREAAPEHLAQFTAQ